MKVLENYKLPPGCSLGLCADCLSDPNSPKWNLDLGGWSASLEGLPVWTWAQGKLRTSNTWSRVPVVWLVVEYETAEAVRLEGYATVPKCKTIAVGADRKEVVSFIQAHTPEEDRGLVLFETKKTKEGAVLVGDGGYAEAGDGYLAKAGDFGIAVAGKGGTATSGEWGSARAGGKGVAVAGDGGHAWVEYKGIAIAGDRGTAIAGDGGIASVGDDGYAYAGDGGTAVTGDGGTARVEAKGTAKAGKGGYLCFGIKRFPVGESGIKPNVYYKLDASGTLKRTRK